LQALRPASPSCSSSFDGPSRIPYTQPSPEPLWINRIKSAVELELATTLASVKLLLLKRSWVSIPKKDSEIGAGGFGAVHRADMQRGLFGPKIAVAVKRFYAAGERSKRLHVALELARELTIHALLDHPNILPLLCFYLSAELDEAWLVSPYAFNGNICDYFECINPSLNKRLEIVGLVNSQCDFVSDMV
ncbi:hypothetical protein FRB99_003258, partial [Tulasnella sp. 403]